jgi:hypothetical protein
VKETLGENYVTRHTPDFYARKMFNARRGNAESIASWGNRRDMLQMDMRKAASQVCKPEEIIGVLCLIKDLGEDLFHTRSPQ